LAPGTRTEASTRYKTKTDEAWVATTENVFSLLYRCLNASHKKVNILTAPLDFAKKFSCLYVYKPIDALNFEPEPSIFLSLSKQMSANRSKSVDDQPPLGFFSFFPAHASYFFFQTFLKQIDGNQNNKPKTRRHLH
jgi:hypothetical protein